MNQAAGSSNSEQLLLAVKRKRGRPKKDPTLKRIAVSRIPPPGFSIIKEEDKSHHQTGSNVDATNSGILIGQAITGVIDAAFDGGYLLTVRIGDSNTSLRGVVFKPGSFIPVTAGNDVAPQVQMIKRNELYGGALQLNQGTTAMVSQTGTSSRHLGGGRGTLVPVVLQPAITISALNGSSSSSVNHALPAEPSVSRDKDVVVTAEPLAMVLPERPPPSSSSKEQLSLTAKEACHASNVAVHEKEENEGSKQANVLLPTSVEYMSVGQGTYSKMSSSPASHPYTPMSFKNYGAGRMSELLQAVQENVKPFAVEPHELQNPN